MIARTAMRLFQRRGFDEVTVADVARAADVSEKTVFNYFPTKEDLVLRRGEERIVALIAAIRERPEGASLVEPFRRLSEELIDTIEHGPIDAITAVPRLVHGSSALRDRLMIGWEREAQTLTPVIAAELGMDEHHVAAGLVARSLAWAHRLVFRAAFGRLLAGERDRTRLAADLREQADRAYDMLEQTIADVSGDRQGAGAA